MRLKPERSQEYGNLEVLRLLANAYKHSPSKQPSPKLLKQLALETGINYAPLPESQSLQEGLASFIGLKKDATYCDIADRFIDLGKAFVEEVEELNRESLRRVRRGLVSLNPATFVR
jgi:hypothetical protein